MDIKGGGSIKIFRRNFLSHSAENLRRGPFSAVLQKFPVAKKFMDRGGGGGENQDFPSKIVCLTVPKNFVVETFCTVFQKISDSEKVYGQEGRGEYQDFPSKIFCLTVPKISVAKPLLLH